MGYTEIHKRGNERMFGPALVRRWSGSVTRGNVDRTNQPDLDRTNPLRQLQRNGAEGNKVRNERDRKLVRTAPNSAGLDSTVKSGVSPALVRQHERLATL